MISVVTVPAAKLLSTLPSALNWRNPVETVTNLSSGRMTMSRG